jgi:hypothetical protein
MSGDTITVRTRRVPHPVCLYPIDDMHEAMAGLSEAEKVKVLSGNAAKVYNIRV